MPTPLVPPGLVERSDKILFITHLALGDFAYLQNCFQAFARAHPHLAIHVWVDELRRTSQPAKWAHLRKYALYDWLEACPFVARVYRETYSPELFRQSIRAAREQHYPLVVSLCTLRTPRYARLARKLAPDGFVVGMRSRQSLLAPWRRLAYRKLNAGLDREECSQPGQHISAAFACWFQRLFGLEIAESARFPFVQIPAEWDQYGGRQLEAWRFDPAGRNGGRLVFINPYAKTPKRCWPLVRVVELVGALRQRPDWSNCCCVINAVPEQMTEAAQFLRAYALDRVQLFSAQENFFQLPAILSRCDLVVSVETAVMHLANAVHVPVIALMRQKNPEWVPIDRAHSTVILTANRREWVRAITVSQVLAALPPAVERHRR
jgi:ADP-heptose:LPS heptosyltransferase